MTSEFIEHTTFVIERELPGSPRHAFRFWSDRALKELWNACHPEWAVLEEAFDFRTGGGEVKRWRTPDGEELAYHAYFLDIVPEQRIIYAYEMTFAGRRMSASLATVEFSPLGTQTQMKFTEQAAFLGDKGARRRRVGGTEEGFDRLASAIAEASDAAA